MYSWTLLAISVGLIVGVFHIVLFVGLFIKARKGKQNVVIGSPKQEPTGRQSVCVTDPYSGKLVNLERVSNASSLRSAKSVGFIAYDTKSSAKTSSRGRVTPVFGSGTLNSDKLNRSMASSSRTSMDSEIKTLNINPLFKDETPCPELKSSKLRAREL